MFFFFFFFGGPIRGFRLLSLLRIFIWERFLWSFLGQNRNIKKRGLEREDHVKREGDVFGEATIFYEGGLSFWRGWSDFWKRGGSERRDVLLRESKDLWRVGESFFLLFFEVWEGRIETRKTFRWRAGK